MTPAEYIRRTRVETLHQALLGAAAGQSVTDLMQAVGIVNFGRRAVSHSQAQNVAFQGALTGRQRPLRCSLAALVRLRPNKDIFRFRTAISRAGSQGCGRRN
jgi:hypothetical protein